MEHDTQRLDQLIKKGRDVYASKRKMTTYNSPSLDPGLFNSWRGEVLQYLQGTLELGDKDFNVAEFKDKVTEAHGEYVEIGIGILEGVKASLLAGDFKAPVEQNSLQIVERICDRFHYVTNELKDSKREGKEPLLINDEYDTQYLMRALLRLYFDDIRREEWTPSSAGSSARMDFFLVSEKIAIELKITSKSLNRKKLQSQLIEDIQYYKSYDKCEILVFFVYDPQSVIENPRGFESDISNNQPLPVRVFIRPS